MGLLPGVELDASATTASGAAPNPGKTVRAAVGGVTALTCDEALDAAPTLSLAVTEIV